jgi:quinol-cytochrome oxidoreductase complex cytochrome b subunit
MSRHHVRVTTVENRPAERRRRTLLVALFVVYLMLLTWIILWKPELPYIGAAAGCLGRGS